MKGKYKTDYEVVKTLQKKLNDENYQKKKQGVSSVFRKMELAN